MIDKTNNTMDISLCYRSPEVNVITVHAQEVLCQSGGEYNDPFGEKENI